MRNLLCLSSKWNALAALTYTGDQRRTPCSILSKLFVWSRNLSFSEQQPEPKEKEHICDDSNHHEQEDKADPHVQSKADDEKESEHNQEQSQESDRTRVGLAQWFERI